MWLCIIIGVCINHDCLSMDTGSQTYLVCNVCPALAWLETVFSQPQALFQVPPTPKATMPLLNFDTMIHRFTLLSKYMPCGLPCNLKLSFHFVYLSIWSGKLRAETCHTLITGRHNDSTPKSISTQESWGLLWTYLQLYINPWQKSLEN